MRSLVRAASVASTLSLISCLGPIGDDTPGSSQHVRARGTTVRALMDDTALVAQVAEHDGIDVPVIPLQPGYAEGVAVSYWDFGETPRFAIPVWLFRRCDERGMPLEGDAGMVGHPNLIDAVPGDPAYSPLWEMVVVCVTAKYDGEVIPSRAALRDAIEMGLLHEPTPMGMWANCPVTLATQRMELGAMHEPITPHSGYYRDRTATYYHVAGMAFGVFLLDPTSQLVEAPFVLNVVRADGTSVAAPIFSVARTVGGMSAPGYSGVWREVRVVIDDRAPPARYTRASELVRIDGDDVAAANPSVVAVEVTGRILNWPVQHAPGEG